MEMVFKKGPQLLKVSSQHCDVLTHCHELNYIIIETDTSQIFLLSFISFPIYPILSNSV